MILLGARNEGTTQLHSITTGEEREMGMEEDEGLLDIRKSKVSSEQQSMNRYKYKYK